MKNPASQTHPCSRQAGRGYVRRTGEGENTSRPSRKINFFRCENTLDIDSRFVKLAGLVMKNETTNTVLTFILGALVLLGVIFALKTINQTRELRSLTSQAMAANTGLIREQAFFNDCLEYSKTHPDINRILQPIETKSAIH